MCAAVGEASNHHDRYAVCGDGEGRMERQVHAVMVAWAPDRGDSSGHPPCSSGPDLVSETSSEHVRPPPFSSLPLCVGVRVCVCVDFLWVGECVVVRLSFHPTPLKTHLLPPFCFRGGSKSPYTHTTHDTHTHIPQLRCVCVCVCVCMCVSCATLCLTVGFACTTEIQTPGAGLLHEGELHAQHTSHPHPHTWLLAGLPKTAPRRYCGPGQCPGIVVPHTSTVS